MRTYSAKIKCRTKKAAKQQGRPQCTLRNVQKRAKPRAPPLKLPYLALAKHVHWQRVDVGEGSSLDLSAELLQFADYIKPDVSELEVRRHVISDLEGAVTADFPHCRVELFGSFCAGLSTFLSDLDVSVTSTVNGSSAHIADRWDARADLAEQEEEEEAQWDNSTVDSAVEGCEDGIKGTGTAASSSETSSTVAEVVAWCVHRDPDAKQTEAAAGEVCAAEGGDTWDKSSVQDPLPVVGLHTVYEVLQRYDWVEDLHLRDRARVPIIYLVHGSSIRCDISLDMPQSCTARVLERLKERCGPALFTLSAFLKVYLGQLGLDAPFTGGLGSYKLYVLLAKHILRQCGTPELGPLLLSFLKHYGTKRDLNKTTAVEVDGAERVNFDATRKVREIQLAFKTAHKVLTQAILHGGSGGWKGGVPGAHRPRGTIGTVWADLRSPSLLALLLDTELLCKQRMQARVRCRRYLEDLATEREAAEWGVVSPALSHGSEEQPTTLAAADLTGLEERLSELKSRLQASRRDKQAERTRQQLQEQRRQCVPGDQANGSGLLSGAATGESGSAPSALNSGTASSCATTLPDDANGATASSGLSAVSASSSSSSSVTSSHTASGGNDNSYPVCTEVFRISGAGTGTTHGPQEPTPWCANDGTRGVVAAVVGAGEDDSTSVKPTDMVAVVHANGSGPHGGVRDRQQPQQHQRGLVPQLIQPVPSSRGKEVAGGEVSTEGEKAEKNSSKRAKDVDGVDSDQNSARAKRSKPSEMPTTGTRGVTSAAGEDDDDTKPVPGAPTRKRSVEAHTHRREKDKLNMKLVQEQQRYQHQRVHHQLQQQGQQLQQQQQQYHHHQPYQPQLQEQQRNYHLQQANNLHQQQYHHQQPYQPQLQEHHPRLMQHQQHQQQPNDLHQLNQHQPQQPHYLQHHDHQPYQPQLQEHHPPHLMQHQQLNQQPHRQLQEQQHSHHQYPHPVHQHQYHQQQQEPWGCEHGGVSATPDAPGVHPAAPGVYPAAPGGDPYRYSATCPLDYAACEYSYYFPVPNPVSVPYTPESGPASAAEYYTLVPVPVPVTVPVPVPMYALPHPDHQQPSAGYAWEGANESAPPYPWQPHAHRAASQPGHYQYQHQ